MQARQLWLEIKGTVHLIVTVTVYPCGVAQSWLGVTDINKTLRWTVLLWPSSWASKFCIYPHSPTTYVLSWVESPHYDFALILLAILLFCFFNYSNGTKKRVEDCLVALGFNILSLEIWIYKAGCCNHSLFKEKKIVCT